MQSIRSNRLATQGKTSVMLAIPSCILDMDWEVVGMTGVIHQVLFFSPLKEKTSSPPLLANSSLYLSSLCVSSAPFSPVFESSLAAAWISGLCHRCRQVLSRQSECL
ncbi:hypothetical protein Cni_G25111 [Canna indica]|uniref:Uncharacterized protein n=1 Tax=Canna indica TaxID=4628 RepID=A0AAQ3KX36_9LILI|nr:hypothetical protein Cni_G25111 [Canna indica]